MTIIATLRESAPTTGRGKRLAALSDTQICAAWLNAAGGKANKRIVELYAHLERLDGLLSGHLKPSAKEEWYEHQRQANTRLERYLFVPRVILDRLGARRCYPTQRRVVGPTIKVSDGDIVTYWGEPLVGATLARLYASGELFHLHRCDGCQRWHTRVRRMDKFCSRNCQIKTYASSAEVRERNRLAQERHRKSPGYRKPTKPKMK